MARDEEMAPEDDEGRNKTIKRKERLRKGMEKSCSERRRMDLQKTKKGVERMREELE